MKPTPLRSLFTYMSALSVYVVFAPAAAADPLPNGGEVVFKRILIHEDDDEQLDVPSDESAKLMYFNKAHCVCGQNQSGRQATFGVEIKIDGATSDIDRPGEVWYGTECDNEDQRPLKCSRDDEAGIADLDTIAQETTTKELSVFRLMTPIGETCEDKVYNGAVWVLADADANGTYDYFSSTAIATDSQPPPSATITKARGAEQAIQLTWDTPTERNDDVFMYQAFCMDAAGNKTTEGTNPTTARYDTVRDLCGLDLNEVILTPVTPGGVVPSPAPTPPSPLATLDPAFLCGEAAANATSLRIDGLENGTAYYVSLVAVDKAGNAAGAFVTYPVTPVPAVDFWEDLHDRGSGVEGGVCLITAVYGDGGIAGGLRAFRDQVLATTTAGRWLAARYYQYFGHASWAAHGVIHFGLAIVLLPVVLAALAWQVLGLPLLLALIALLWAWRTRRVTAQRRRSRRSQPGVLPLRAAIPALALTGVVLLPDSAAAQSNRPYWEQGDASEELDEVGVDPVTWRVGLKLGPYVPGVDEQLGESPGPFEDMFGDGGLMVGLDVERILFRRAGHLAIAGSLGWYSRKANAWEHDSVPGDPDRPRTESDSNAFRMIPASIGVSYRLTQLHEHWKVPVVPYVRGGLAYYLWWVDAPNGDVARIEGADDKALGASMGLVGAIGVSLRLEWLDKDAMYAMRDAGTRHAGIYAEIQGGKVDGFGSDTKLSVGDTTWFAGVDFEF